MLLPGAVDVHAMLVGNPIALNLPLSQDSCVCSTRTCACEPLAESDEDLQGSGHVLTCKECVAACLSAKTEIPRNPEQSRAISVIIY